MTWPRALSLWIVAIALGMIYVATQPAPSPPSAVMAEDRPTPPPSAVERRAYELDPAALVRVEVRRGDAAVTLERGDAGWRVASSTLGKTIPAGLVQAFVDQLVDSGHGERVADDPHEPAYGLDAPTLRIAASESGGRQLTLVLGAKTPTGAAVYALVEPGGGVVLVGLNLVYYADLLLG